MKRRVCCLLPVLLLVGCTGESLDPATMSLRDKFMLTTQPAEPLSLTAVAEQLTASPTPAEPQEVIAIGRIYAGELEPWEAGKASFVLSELPAEGHGEGHDADNCPFCKRRAERAPTAVVRFLDDQHQTLAVDARKLLGVEKGQTVVVQGTVTLGELNSLHLIAERVFVVATSGSKAH